MFVNFMFAASHCNAGTERFSPKFFRLMRMAAPANAMASEQLAALMKLPGEAGPPLKACTHMLSPPAPPPPPPRPPRPPAAGSGIPLAARYRSEEHTSELQALRHLVCRL